MAALTFQPLTVSLVSTETGSPTQFSDSAENIANAVKIIGQGVDYTPFHG